MHLVRAAIATAVLLGILAGPMPAQKKKKPGADDGYIPVVAPENKQKKDRDVTQTLPAAKDLPNAVEADTDRLTFEVSALSAQGLLTPQTRAALKALLHSSRGTIVELRVFVAGSGDLRRIGELVGEAFSEKHAPLPVLSVVQVGGLPMAGAQVVMEATELERRTVNPNGVAFLSGQPAASVRESLTKLTNLLRPAGMDGSDVLRATCFVSSLDDQRDARELMASQFPSAAVNYVQMQREPVEPQAECEAVARMRRAAAAPVSDFLPEGAFRNPASSFMVAVKTQKLVITGAQLAFGGQDSDAKLAFERLEKVLNTMGARPGRVVMSHVYLMSSGLGKRVSAVQTVAFKGANPPAGTLLPFEGLPSLDASFGLDVVAVADGEGR